MPRDQIKQLQDERLVAQVKRMYERVECFRIRMDEAGLKPDDIHGTEDLHRLPFSYKSDLRDYYPYGLFAEPMQNIVRVHASSGTTGKRIVVGYTQNDLDLWAECVARMMNGLGLDEKDFSFITTFDAFHAAKPSIRYYSEVCEKLGVRPQDCLLIGNDAEEDGAAREIGMPVLLTTDCLINKKELPLAYFEKGTLKEVLAWAQQL
jgi:hypothetical protein